MEANTSKDQPKLSRAQQLFQRFPIGQIGGDYLLEQLASSSQPQKVIEEFQQKNGLYYCKNADPLTNSPNEAPLFVLPLLDLLGVPRREVYMNIVNALSEGLITQLSASDKSKLEPILELTFPYIGFEQLRPVVIATLRRMDNIPTRYLKQLSSRTDLYEICPIEVKRQIWQFSESIFQSEFFKILNNYVTDPLVYEAVYELYFDDKNPPPPPVKRRKQTPSLQAVAELIGSYSKLYEMAVHLLRNVFINTGNEVCCALRAELLMCIHDNGLLEIAGEDPCHTFAWCLDACCRDNNFEERRVNEMKSFFDGLSKGSPILGDLGMILENPIAQHTIIRNIYSTLVGVVKRQAIPKDDNELSYLTHLLSLSLQSREMIEAQHFFFPTVEKELLTKFYPLLANLIIDDLSRQPNASEERQIDSQFVEMFSSHKLARKIVLYYIITRIRRKDHVYVSQLLKIVHELGVAQVIEEPSFIYSLASEVISIKHPQLRVAIVDGFLMQYKDASLFIHKQLVRILGSIHARLQMKDLIGYLYKLVPPDASQANVTKLAPIYKGFLERVGDRLHEGNARFLFEFLGIRSRRQEISTTSPTTYSPTSPQGSLREMDSPQYRPVSSPVNQGDEEGAIPE